MDLRVFSTSSQILSKLALNFSPLSLLDSTAEDLGEIILHGEGTHTREFLNKIPLSVNPHRGSDRLEIRREIL